MDKQLTMSASISIHAPAASVWSAITDKEKIKSYFFGTDVDSDWKKGSPVIWSGEWEGKHYEEKGEVLDVEKGKLLSYSYLSSGQEDIPENYSVIVYKLEGNGNGETQFTITQSNFANQEACDHSKENWKTILTGLKKVAEGV
ncbi:SRPBCC family protein [Chitinophaga sp.]|uniref:SRPBCC family protein n=1 Tax=Chitinophaga sp. TaxID=1869181 RepID=UPI002F95BCFD